VRESGLESGFESIGPEALCCVDGSTSFSPLLPVLSCCKYTKPPAASTSAQTPAIAVLRRFHPSGSGSTSSSGSS
jgi:hypothetical protein